MDLKQIQILQANCWKSREKVMIHLFGEKEVRDLEILAIQEPYINRYTDQVTTYSQMLGNRFHLLIKPTSKDTNMANMPRVCFFVSKALDPTKWAIQHHTKDLSTLTLRTRIGPICDGLVTFDKDRSDKWLTRVARSGGSYSRCVRIYCRLSTQSVAYAHIHSLDNTALR